MSQSTRRSLVATVVAAALVITACGNDGDDGGDAIPREATSSTVAEAAFPVTVMAENGPVDVVTAPERIVSLSASLTELLFAIGAGEQVVAVDKYSDFPAETPRTELSGFRPNIEAIGGYEPDLVVVASDRDGLVTALAGVGIPTLLLTSADSLDDVYAQIDVLGLATGHPAAADALAEAMRADLDEVVAGLPDRDAPLRYFYELSPDLHSVTSASFIGEVLSLAGLMSIADGVDDAAGGFPQLSAEYVLDADPDVIFLAHTDGTGQDPAEVATRAGWADLRAVQDERVVALPDDLSARWGPRVVDLLRAVALATSDLQARGTGQ